MGTQLRFYLWTRIGGSRDLARFMKEIENITTCIVIHRRIVFTVRSGLILFCAKLAISQAGQSNR